MDLARGDDPLAGGLNKYLKGGYHKNANIIRGVDDHRRCDRRDDSLRQAPRARQPAS